MHAVIKACSQRSKPRPEIAGQGAVMLPCLLPSLFAGQFQVQPSIIIPDRQPPGRGWPNSGPVKRGPVLQQQSRFHGNRLGGRAADPPLDIRSAMDQAEGPARMPVRIHMPVASEPLFEAPRLADVEKLAGLIMEKVDAWGCGESPKKFRSEPGHQRAGCGEQQRLAATGRGHGHLVKVTGYPMSRPRAMGSPP